MRDILVVLRYAFSHKKYAVLNLIFNILSVVFTLFSFTLVVPFLQILFEKQQLVTEPAAWAMSVDAIKQNLFYLLSQIIVEQGKFAALVVVSVLMIIGTLLKNIFAYMASYYMAPVMNGTVRDFQKRIYDKIMRLPVKFFSEERKGDIMARASGDIQEVKFTVTNTVEVLMRDPMTIVFYLLYLIYISSGLTVFVLLVIPIIGLIIGKIGKNLKRKSHQAQEKAGEILTVLEESLGGLRIVKAFNAEKQMLTRYRKLTDKYFEIMNKVTRRNSLSSPLSEFLGTAVISGVIIYGGQLILNSESNLSGEEFIMFIVIFSQILNPAKALSKAYYSIKKGAASIDRINKVLDAEEEIDNGTQDLEHFQYQIEYRNVSFKYGDEYVLKNVNLTIPKGKTVALVGQSGSGKSTLADLLPRFYDLEEGEVLIDGINVKGLKLKSLRRLMGNVNQDPILFNASIAENIAFGLETASQADIEQAARIANAHEFILETENGYATNIGDRGSKLSGGQRQRISIARAVLNNPPVMILDEATSALDTESERLVQDALSKLMQNRTSLVIAHRLSTIKNADEICVMHRGEIIERGTHAELLAKGETYKKLHDLQAF